MTFRLVDAQAAMGFVTKQSSYIETAVNRAPRPEIQYPFLIPVDTSANPWASTVTYYSSNQSGAADWVNGNASDIPLANSTLSKHETPVYMAAIGYGYGLEEISKAMMLGYNLTSEYAMSARRAYEEMVERVALTGDTQKGFYGLVNCPDVTEDTAGTGDWATATTANIIKDINDALTGLSSGTNFIIYADTLLLPYEQYQLLATTMIGSDGAMTVLEWIRRNNVYTAETGQPLMIRGMRGLSGVGAGSTDRMIVYRRNPEVLKLHIPMPHQFRPVFQKNALYFEVPGIFRLGGLDVRRPKEVLYVDGI